MKRMHIENSPYILKYRTEKYVSELRERTWKFFSEIRFKEERISVIRHG
jgi:hypothetical protein